MTKKQKRNVIITLIFAAICLVLPYIFNFLESNDELIKFEGTIDRTELKLSNKDSDGFLRWSNVLIKEKLDYFWIYFETKDKKVAFMVESFPDLTKKLSTLHQCDYVTIHAIKDDLNRGHYFPRIIQRADELFLEKDYMKLYWQRNHYRILRYLGLFIAIIACLEMIYFKWINNSDKAEDISGDND